MKKLSLWAAILISTSLFSQKLDVVGGYFPYYRSTSNVNFGNYNYLYYAFVSPTPLGGLQLTGGNATPFNNFKSATNTLKSKRLISIATEGMSVMAANPKARLAFADTLRKFCKVHKLDGIDLDWESIDNAKDRSSFTALCDDIRGTIDTTNLLFTITIGFGNYWMQWYENDALLQADFLQIMVYDQTGTWPGSPYGNHASMDHFKEAEAYWVRRGFTRDLLVMGLPYYGYNFQSKSGGSAPAASYSDILARFPNMRASDNELSDASGYYFFNGADLIKEKINYAISKGFKGVFVWEIAQDNTKNPLSLDNTLANTAYDRIASVTELENLKPVLIYPNPSSGVITIDGLMNDTEITIQNTIGANVYYKKSITDTEAISIDGLPAGIYIVILKSQDSQKQQKIVIE